MNRVVLMGRLTRDPEVRYSQGQEPMAITRFTLAVDRRRRTGDNQQNADFITCVAFGRSAETLGQYVGKGGKICLDGHIQTGSYTNKEGQKVYTTDVIVDSWEFAESKADKGAGREAKPSSNPDCDGFMMIPDGVDDSGLPFN